MQVFAYDKDLFCPLPVNPILGTLPMQPSIDLISRMTTDNLEAIRQGFLMSVASMGHVTRTLLQPRTTWPRSCKASMRSDWQSSAIINNIWCWNGKTFFFSSWEPDLNELRVYKQRPPSPAVCLQNHNEVAWVLENQQDLTEAKYLMRKIWHTRWAVELAIQRQSCMSITVTQVLLMKGLRREPSK